MSSFSLEDLLRFTNTTLTAIITIVSASMLLYNLSRNRYSPVAQASSILLACVTAVSATDILTSFALTRGSLDVWLRIQWIGIAFAPAAMFHLSDALLATTGLVSRGRRRRVVYRLYILSALFLILALATDTLAYGLILLPAPLQLAGPVFPLYVAYFIIATIVSVYNVLRARQRCLTTYTHRRMGYLLYSFTLPALGIFPYSLLFAGIADSSLSFWLLVNLSNLGMAFMLVFMAYPLSFFGSNIPDRVVRTELLDFFLRGPAAGILVLLVIVYLPRAGHILGLPGEEFMPFAAVATVMFWQWMASLFLPYLERLLIYPDDQIQIKMIQAIGRRLLTHNDLQQLFEAVLAAVCDLLQVPAAFLGTVKGDSIQIEQGLGQWQEEVRWEEDLELIQMLNNHQNGRMSIIEYRGFWMVPLYSTRIHDTASNGTPVQRLLGLIAVKARNGHVNVSPEEQRVFDILVRDAAQALDDQRLQKEIFASIEGLLPQMDAIQRLRDAAQYGAYPMMIETEERGMVALQPEFVNAVRDALRDYWGGPRLTQSPLLQMEIVRAEIDNGEGTPTRALRAVLLKAINRLRPEGDRSMTRSEWTLYNIVELRFVQGHKVRDVAKRLVMSEADLYRKQRSAIEEVARILALMEHESLTSNGSTLAS